jgi:hypothetical protein
VAAATISLLLLAGCGDDDDWRTDAANACAAAAPQLLNDCVASVNAAWQSCLRDDGAPCAAEDDGIVAALDALENGARDVCGDGDYDGLSVDGVVGRWRYACRSETDALAWRALGGPQAAVWNRNTSAQVRTCLAGTHEAGARVLEDRLAAVVACLDDDGCNPADPGADAAIAAAAAGIEAACGTIPTDRLIALPPTIFAERTARQAQCLAATTHVDPRFPLACGPSNAVAEAARGEYVRVVLDGDEWGTRCGDGSPYAFDIRLAPEGAPLDRVVIGLQGGGVCFFNDDCSARFRSAPGLFTAADDLPPVTGIFSNDPDDSAFADWTKVYLPYCNQDVFIGGGITESFDALPLHRYGAVNLRAALQAFRDILWKTMDAEGGDGYRPDELVALFGGWSAGGYGTMYNYHWVLDDLLWQRTAAFPDAGLGFDNGGLGVRTFGGLQIPVWNALTFLPPYCFVGACAVGPEIFAATAPRLKQVPEQQYLIVSNQFDETQRGDAFFASAPPFINAMRRGYCETKDLDGIHWFLMSVSDTSRHVVSVFPDLWETGVAGIAMRDWFAGAIADPDAVVDRAEEADFTTAIPGVQPFPCDVAP